MDPDDMLSLQRRSDLVTYLTCWTSDAIEQPILDAMLDAMPEVPCVGWVIVWMPFNEGDYEAIWCPSWLHMRWNIWKAKRDRSPLCFVLDLKLAWLESAVSTCGEEEYEDDAPYDYEDDDDWVPPN